MKWHGLEGEILGDTFSAILGLTKEPGWYASIQKDGDDLQSKIFEEGELEQAHEWCTTKLKEHDEGSSKAGRSGESAS